MHFPGVTEMSFEVIGYLCIIGTRLKPLFVNHAPVSLLVGTGVDFLIRIVFGVGGKIVRVVQILDMQPCPFTLVVTVELIGQELQDTQRMGKTAVMCGLLTTKAPAPHDLLP